MAGNRESGLVAAQTNKERYGEDFYSRIGALGGKLSKTGGFYANRELARRAGAIGGAVSRKTGPNTNPTRRKGSNVQD